MNITGITGNYAVKSTNCTSFGNTQFSMNPQFDRVVFAQNKANDELVLNRPKNMFPDIENDVKLQKKVFSVKNEGVQLYTKSKEVLDSADKISEQVRAVVNKILLSETTVQKGTLINSGNCFLVEHSLDNGNIRFFQDSMTGEIKQVGTTLKNGLRKENALIRFNGSNVIVDVPYEARNNKEKSGKAFCFNKDYVLTNYYENKVRDLNSNTIEYALGLNFNNKTLSYTDSKVKILQKNNAELYVADKFYKFKNGVATEYLEGSATMFDRTTGNTIEQRCNGALIFGETDIVKVQNDYSHSKTSQNAQSETILTIVQDSNNEDEINKINTLAETELLKATELKDNAIELYHEANAFLAKVTQEFAQASSINSVGNVNVKIKIGDDGRACLERSKHGKLLYGATMSSKTTIDENGNKISLPKEIRDSENNKTYKFDDDGNLIEVTEKHNWKAVRAYYNPTVIYTFTPTGYLKACSVDKRAVAKGVQTSDSSYVYTKDGKLDVCQIGTTLSKQGVYPKAETKYLLKFDSNEKLSKCFLNRVKSATTKDDVTEAAEKLYTFNRKDLVRAMQDCIVSDVGIESAEKYGAFELDGKNIKLTGTITK